MLLKKKKFFLNFSCAFSVLKLKMIPTMRRARKVKREKHPKKESMRNDPNEKRKAKRRGRMSQM